MQPSPIAETFRSLPSVRVSMCPPVGRCRRIPLKHRLVAADRPCRSRYRQCLPWPRSGTYAGGVDAKSEIREFLTSRRARLTPVVAVLHAEAGRDSADRDLSDLVGELSTRSEPFRALWAAHNVHRHDTGVKTVLHP